MIEILSTLLTKLLDIVITRVLPGRGKRKGIRLLYHVYISLYDIIRTSNNLLYEINAYLQNDEEHWETVGLELYWLGKHLEQFAKDFSVVQYYISIFDHETHKALIQLIGIKQERIRYLASLLYPQGEVLASLPIHRYYPFVEDPESYDLTPLPEDRLYRGLGNMWDGYIHIEPIFLTEQDKDKLRQEYERGVKTLRNLESLLERYADFLKANFELEDLFEKVHPDAKSRIRY